MAGFDFMNTSPSYNMPFLSPVAGAQALSGQPMQSQTKTSEQKQAPTKSFTQKAKDIWTGNVDQGTKNDFQQFLGNLGMALAPGADSWQYRLGQNATTAGVNANYVNMLNAMQQQPVQAGQVQPGMWQMLMSPYAYNPMSLGSLAQMNSVGGK